jgi:hypothetical protein
MLRQACEQQFQLTGRVLSYDVLERLTQVRAVSNESRRHKVLADLFIEDNLQVRRNDSRILFAIPPRPPAINLLRIASWADRTPLAKTRCSHFAALLFHAA